MQVVAIGEVVVDWLSLKPGETIFTATEFHRALGGNSTNVAIGLQRLGTDVSLVGKIGGDFHGEFLKLALSAENVSLEWIITDDRYPTTQCYMTTTAEGAHHFRNWPHPHASDMMTVEELPVELLKRADILHTTGISMVVDPRRTAIERAIDITREAGGIVSFDAGFPTTARDQARRRMEAVLPKAHLLKMNESEVLYWTEGRGDMDSEERGRVAFERYRPTALLLTKAAQGSVIFTADETIHCAPLAVNAVSEVGAGDGYVAGLIHWLTETLAGAKRPLSHALPGLTREQWHHAGLAGNVAGALTTRQESAYGSMPSRAEFESAIRSLGAGLDVNKPT